MSSPEPQPRQQKPRGYEQLSDEYKQMWDDIALNHPWFNHSKDKPKLSNSNN